MIVGAGVPQCHRYCCRRRRQLWQQNDKSVSLATVAAAPLISMAGHAARWTCSPSSELFARTLREAHATCCCAALEINGRQMAMKAQLTTTHYGCFPARLIDHTTAARGERDLWLSSGQIGNKSIAHGKREQQVAIIYSRRPFVCSLCGFPCGCAPRLCEARRRGRWRHKSRNRDRMGVHARAARECRK